MEIISIKTDLAIKELEMKVVHNDQNSKVMYKALRNILNRERANGNYTGASIKEIMDITREALKTVISEDG